MLRPHVHGLNDLEIVWIVDNGFNNLAFRLFCYIPRFMIPGYER